MQATNHRASRAKEITTPKLQQIKLFGGGTWGREKKGRGQFPEEGVGGGGWRNSPWTQGGGAKSRKVLQRKKKLAKDGELSESHYVRGIRLTLENGRHVGLLGRTYLFKKTIFDRST